MTHRFLNADAREAKALHERKATAVLRPFKYSDENTRGCGPGMVLLSGHHATPIRDGVGLVWRPFAGSPEVPMPPEKAAEFCPHGRIGDVIGFRETWSPDHKDFYPNFPVVYKADGYPSDHEIELGKIYGEETKAYHPFRWRSAATMPRHYIRTRRPIASIEPIRVAEMTEEQARALGVEPDEILTTVQLPPFGRLRIYEYVAPLRQLYEHRHGDGSWARDWAWLIGLGEATG